jgi:cell division septation protein DedD
MNIRCSFCQTPYTLSRVAMLDALQEMDAGNLSHYDAHCPRCRRATQIPRQRLEMAMPNWRDELKQFEKEMKENPQHEAPLPKAESSPVAQTVAAPEPAAAKKGASKPKQTARQTVEGSPKPAARQTTPSADTKKSNQRRTTKGTSKKSK